MRLSEEANYKGAVCIQAVLNRKTLLQCCDTFFSTHSHGSMFLTYNRSSTSLEEEIILRASVNTVTINCQTLKDALNIETLLTTFPLKPDTRFIF